MKPKNILGLGLVLSGIIISATTAPAQPGGGDTSAGQVSLTEILRENGPKLECHFTLESQGEDITGKVSIVNTPVRTNLNADSIPSFVSKLRNYLDGFIVVEDARNPKIVHIIDKVLADDPNYCLNKRISVNYSGSLGLSRAPDPNKPGSEILVGGLIPAVAEKSGRIMVGSQQTTSGGAAGSDNTTRITVSATNETVRSIITDCLPDNYKPVMWRATTAIRPGLDGKVWVFVQFLGQRIQNRP